MGQSKRRVLLDIRDPDSPTAAVSHSLSNFIPGVPDNDADILDACLAESFYAVEQNGFIGDGDKLLGLCVSLHHPLY